jgi:acetyl esterase/lipase
MVRSAHVYSDLREVCDRVDLPLRAYGALTTATTFSLEKHVTAQTPPFFLYATGTDARAPVLSSVVFYTALEKAGVPAELHIFEQGPHGTGLAQTYAALSEWPTLLTNWLRLHGWLPPQK